MNNKEKQQILFIFTQLIITHIQFVSSQSVTLYSNFYHFSDIECILHNSVM